MSDPYARQPGADDNTQNIAAAIADVSDRATQLVREEIELAKAEVTQKAGRLARGAAVGVVAGVFLLTALWMALIGLAWLLYYYLPVGNAFTYFYGFFAMAVILLLVGGIAVLIAIRLVKRGSPPVPEMAIAEARKTRDVVAAPTAPPTGPPVGGPPAPPAPPVPPGPGAADAVPPEGA